MNIKVTPFHWDELLKRGYSLDHIVLLRWINEQMNLTDLLKSGSAKISGLYQALSRKGLITEDGSKLTTLGLELLTFMDSKEPRKLLRKKPDTTDFKLWWKTFPGTDIFTHKGRSFSGGRSLRVGEEECRLKFDKILLEGEYSAQDLISALEYDVLQKKEQSVRLGQNKLTYMQNSLTYLNQRSYEPFIELIRDNSLTKEAPSKSSGGVDI